MYAMELFYCIINVLKLYHTYNNLEIFNDGNQVVSLTMSTSQLF